MTSSTGWVEEALGGVYRVVLEDGRRVEASVRGRLKQSGGGTERIVVGDVVRVTAEGDTWAIAERGARRSELVRAGFRARAGKVIAANLDHIAVMVAAADPAAREEWIDRMLVIGEHAGLTPLLLINKLDLPGAPERVAALTHLYAAVGYPVHAVSVVSGTGLEALREALTGHESALVGPSGVGKSSVLNALVPDLAARTGTVSGDGRGRHTTVSSRAVPLAGGGHVVDTPGFADAEPWDVPPEDLDLCFPELRVLRAQCRFRACTHMHEPGCAVRDALGVQVPESRYRSYRKLRDSLEERARRDW
ncbi:MAG: ribosome small subunit-dependent GTPase A [Gemmatimonadota bacterium]|nr:ribosome small subunit-dependent GTPase A [Gemmatimonadota bacterium]